MPRADVSTETVLNLTLEELTDRIAAHLHPIVQRRLAHPDAEEAAREMIAEALRVLPSMLTRGIQPTADDEHALAASLAASLAGARAKAAPKILVHHVREAADAIATTWVDVLDQGLTKHRSLDLHPEKMIPVPRQYPELYEILEESLLPTLLTPEDAGHVMHALHQELMAGGKQLALPLGIRLRSVPGGCIRAEREHATG